MLSDLDVIVKTYPRDQEVLRIYAIGDVHVGSPEFNEDAIRKKLQIIADDPYGCLVLCGDLGDYGLKNSKTNVYKAIMSPREQQDYIYELFLPVVDKLTAAVPGNHEERITREVGTCPLYDLCVLWGISDIYRENLAITKYCFGNVGGRKTQNVFVGATSHGTTRNKNHKFMGSVDSIDFSISGHTHSPEYSPHGRIRVDRQHGTASHVPYKELIVDANLKPGGYGLRKQFEVPPPPELQYLELSMYREADYNRTERRVMNYHAIQI